MKEREIVVRDNQLAFMWYKKAVFAFNDLIDKIEIDNMSYGFNLLDNDEELSRKAQEHKIAIKYGNIGTPLMVALEEMLKSVLIAHRYWQNPSVFNRGKIVKEIMRDVRKEENSVNGHDCYAIINYITNHVDPMFLTRFANEYAIARDHKMIFNNPLSRNSAIDFQTSEERVQAATREYTQGFLEFRYLFETSETYNKNMDLTKLVQYGYAIQECSLQLLKAYYAVNDLVEVQDILRGFARVKLSSVVDKKVEEAIEETIDYVSSVMTEAGVDFKGIIRKHILEKVINGTSANEDQTISSVQSCLLDYGMIGQEVTATEQVAYDSSDMYREFEMVLGPSEDFSDNGDKLTQEMVEAKKSSSVVVGDEFSQMSDEDLKQRLNEILAVVNESSDAKTGESSIVKK